MAEQESYPADLKYNAEHTWLKIEPDGKATVGVTDYAQRQLKDVVFVGLPESGTTVVQMDPFGVIESAKATNDLYSPVSGTVIDINDHLSDDPGLVNRDPYGAGWMITIELSDPSEVQKLISSVEYRALTSGK